MPEDAIEIVHKSDTDQVNIKDDGPVGIVMTRDDKSWRYQWRGVLRRYSEIEAVYNGRYDVPASKSSEYWRDQVYDFFVACYTLKDHITKTEPAAKPHVEAYVHQTYSLTLAGAIANTYKHHTVFSGHATAEITKTSATIHGPTVSDSGAIADGFASASYIIEYTDKSGSVSEVDALDLASSSINDWRMFFAQRSLDEE